MIITTRSPNVQYVRSLRRTNSNNCWYQAMKTRVLGLTQGISKQTHSLFPHVVFLCTVYLFCISSNPPADDWSKRGLTTVTEDSTTTITNYNNYLTNWNSSYRLPYSTQSQLLPTEEPTKRVTKLVTNINKNWRDFNITKTKDDKEPTTTGSGTSLPVP